MSWVLTHWLQLAFVAVYLAILTHHAWLGNRHTHTLSDYLIADRGLGGWLIALSFYATFVSTNSFVGHAGKSWDVGLIWYVKGLAYILLCVAAWFLVAPRFVKRARDYGSLTVADFLGYRYDSIALRRMAAVVVCVASLSYLVAVYKGSALALGQFLGVSYPLAVVLIFVVVTAYTLAGGFRSVVLTDAVQGVLMVVGAVAIIVAVVVQGGGVATLLDSVRRQDPALVSWRGKMPLATLVGLSVAGGLKFLVDPRQLSRFYGLRDETALRRARIVSPLLLLVTYVALLPVGALAHALIPADTIHDSDHVVPYLLGTTRIFGPAVGSLFLLVLVAAAMSSLDSVLLVAASTIDHDLVAPGAAADAQAVARTRKWVGVLSVAGMMLALVPFAGIVEISAFSGSLYGACFLPTLVGGLFWNRATAAGAQACVIGGGVAVIGWFLAERWGWTSWHEVYAGLIVGTTAYVGVSWATARSVPGESIR